MWLLSIHNIYPDWREIFTWLSTRDPPHVGRWENRLRWFIDTIAKIPYVWHPRATLWEVIYAHHTYIYFIDSPLKFIPTALIKFHWLFDYHPYFVFLCWIPDAYLGYIYYIYFFSLSFCLLQTINIIYGIWNLIQSLIYDVTISCILMSCFDLWLYLYLYIKYGFIYRLCTPNITYRH